MQRLVQAKADVDEASAAGRTSAFSAAQNGHSDALQVLVQAKADVDKGRTDDGATPRFRGS